MAKEDETFNSLPLEIRHLNLTQKRLELIEKVLGSQSATMEEVGEVALTALGFLVGDRYLTASDLEQPTDLGQRWELQERLKQIDARLGTARLIRDAVKRSPRDPFVLDDSQFGQQVRTIAEWAKPIAQKRVEFYQKR